MNKHASKQLLTNKQSKERTGEQKKKKQQQQQQQTNKQTVKNTPTKKLPTHPTIHSSTQPMFLCFLVSAGSCELSVCPYGTVCRSLTNDYTCDCVTVGFSAVHEMNCQGEQESELSKFIMTSRFVYVGERIAKSNKKFNKFCSLRNSLN